MTRRRKHTNERGAALLLAICGLVLITAVAIGMLFASDTETTISVNYRDKQVAIYAALSGLQEARDRIHPCQGDLGKGTGGNCLTGGLNLVPTALPSTSAKNILYIINPGPTESASDIKPWDPNNKYFDTELCHEQILGLTGTDGVPCPATSASVPSGSDWYQAYDNSAHSTAWQLKDAVGNRIPLMYKWVRVQLKTDGSTPVPITVASSATGKQVCWDGSHEQPIGPSAHSDCTPAADGVTHITVTYGGSGYNPASPPTVRLTGGSGTGATATAQIGQLPTGVTSVTLLDGGAGYSSTTPPNVQIISSDGNGFGASVTPVIGGAGAPVTGVSLQNGTPPACYPGGTTASSFAVTFNPSGATGSVTAVTGTRCVYSFGANGTCNKDMTAHVTAANGSGSGFAGTVSFGTNKKVTGVNLTNPGDYSTVPSSFSLDQGCTGVTITPVYGVQIANITGSGGTYAAAPTVSITGPVAIGGSTTATASIGASTGNGRVTNFVNLVGGSGYTANPTVVIDDPPAGVGHKTATATASITPDVGVLGITVNSAGSGYTPSNPPTVTIDPPASGTPATAVATVGSGGTYQGAVYLLTSMAQTATGARAMTQMEIGVTYEQYSLSLGGALTLAGPSPTFNTPNSNPFKIIGTDCTTCGTPPSSCSSTALPPKPSIGVYDDPNHPTTPTAVSSVIDSLGKPQNYTGAHGAPDIENAYASLGDPTPQGLNAFMQVVKSVAQSQYTSYNTNPSNIALGTAQNPVVDFVNGDYTMGPTTGYGILAITGTLSFHGNYSWNGLILVIGSGASIMDGGGNGQIVGSVFLANTNGGTPPGSALGSPNASFAGGGGNGIQYDHCWADDLLANLHYTPPVSANALKVISLRTLEY